MIKEKSTYEIKKYVPELEKQMSFIKQTIQVDNGSEFVNGEEKAESRSVFEKAVKVLSIGLRCIRLYSPRQNGKVERSNKGTAKFYIIVRLISEEKLIEQI